MNSTSLSRQATKPRSNPLSGSLLEALIPLPKAQKQPDQVISVLGHEVRNPLTNINLAVELLKSGLREEERKIYLDIIVRSSIRINELVNELLENHAAEDIKDKNHSISQLLDEVIEMAKDRIRLKNITVIKLYAVQDCKVLLNRSNMKMALTNIIINAIDAMPFEKGELRLVTKSIYGKYILQIEDNGIGISKLNLKNIFKPYYTNKAGGMGLGLSTTLDILLANHARVNVQSEVGKGTRFTLLFNSSLKPEILG